MLRLQQKRVWAHSDFDIEMARTNFVTVICLPSHCNNRMQPLDVSFMKPLMTYYTQAVECRLQFHPGRVVSTFQIAELFGIGYVRSAALKTAVTGLRKTGIWPIDRNVLDEHDFVAAQPTDVVRQPNTDAPPRDRDTDAPPRDRDTDAPPRDRDADAPPRDRDTDAPPRDRDTDATPRDRYTDALPRDRDTDAPPRDRHTVMSASPPTHRQAPHIAISVVSPVPKINQATVRKATQRGKTCIITGSPYKTPLEAKGKLVTCPQPSSSSS